MFPISQKPYGWFAVVTVVSLLSAVALETPYALAIPAALLLIFLAITDYRSLFFLLLASLPFSVEYQFPNGFGTDLPTEPLTVGLMLIFLLTLFAKKSLGEAEILRGSLFFKHPISLMLMVGLAWATVATLNAVDTAIATKYMLAKVWYIVTFYYLGGRLLKGKI